MSSISGIMLAGGAASRMPNKALLPIASNRIVIESGIEFLSSKCEETVVVVSPNSPIPDVLKMRGYNPWYVQQSVPLGVVSAIQCGAQRCVHDLCLIVFCDNVYSEVTQNLVAEPHASLRWSSDPSHLDTYSELGRKWVRRSIEHDDLEQPSLLGWYLLDRSQILSADQRQSSVDFLNELNVKPKFYPDAVYDIGTPETYSHYLKHVMER